jgi:ABC-type transport system involved in multi-copper enzyme maturation permease subunit
LREKGGWGKPNPFYDRLSQFSPFLIIGVILFGICAGAANPGLLAANDGVVAFWCLLCLPAMLLNMLTMFASLMAPALTAPSISMERSRGTWDVLRTTPLSTRSILLAKLFGALSRLRIWRALLVLSILQGIMMAFSMTVSSEVVLAAGILAGAATALRPWLEILFAGFTGMYVSTRVRSTTAALAISYAIVMLLKLTNGTTSWMLVSTMFELNEMMFAAGIIAPAVVYAGFLAMLWLGLSRRASRLAYE